MEFDWKKYRAIKMKADNLSYENVVRCPVCGQKGKVKNMDCHHLIPKHVAPHLAYNPSNMVFVHKDCHKKIHEFMGESKTKNIYIENTEEQPHKWKKAELLEKYLELAGYFKNAVDDMFNQKAIHYIAPQRCPYWVKRWKRRTGRY